MSKRALVIVNPGAGSASQRTLEAALERRAGTIEARVRRLADGEDAESVTRRELREEWDVVVAAGGDGTVSGVARAVREARVPIAIAPMGTANLLAEQLGVPGDLEGAIALLAGESSVRRIDGMEVGGRLYFLNVGVGVSAKTVRDMRDADKRRFGIAAYYWTGIASGFSFDPVPCSVSIDGAEEHLRILEVSVVNAGFRSDAPIPGVPDVRPDDGRLDVLIIWAPRPLEYLRHLSRALLKWRRVRPNVQWRTAERVVRIHCATALPIQADGDLIGETPVAIRLVRDAASVVVPRASYSVEP